MMLININIAWPKKRREIRDRQADTKDIMSSEPTLHLYYYLKDITALKVLHGYYRLNIEEKAVRNQIHSCDP